MGFAAITDAKYNLFSLLLPQKLQNYWRGTNFTVAKDLRRGVACAVKGGRCNYDSEVVDSARNFEQWTFRGSYEKAYIDSEKRRSLEGLRYHASAKNCRALERG